MSEKKRVIDVACGSKMFWFDKKNPDVEYCDKRTVEYHEFYPKRYIEIRTVEDIVFSLTEGGLSGIEQVAELEHASGPLMLSEAEAVVDILLGGSGE